MNSADDIIWTRESVLEWFESHGKRPLVMGQRGTAFRIEGLIKGVEQLDACSAQFQECELITPLPELQIALSFHQDRLSVHALGRDPASGDVVLSLPHGIPYDELFLSDPTESTKGKDDPDQASFFSPYELL